MKPGRIVQIGILSLMLLASGARAFERLDAARIEAIAGWLPAEPAGVGPACSDRSAWQGAAISQRLREVVKEADKRLTQPFPAWRDEDYLDYSRTGQRDAGERMMNARSAWLYPLVMAECLDGQGRYLARIQDTLDELLRQPTWTWPAHDRRLASFHGSRYEVDLMAADLAHDLAQTLWLLGDRLPETTRERVRTALEQRIFAPMRASLSDPADKRHWWLAAEHNWNAVCLKGVVGAALAVLPDRHDRARFAADGEQFIAHYREGFLPDGYTGEGPGYWNYGFSHFAALREQLMQASSGHLDLFASPKVRAMALYGAQIEMLPGNVAAFADASPTTRIDAFSLAYANQALGLGLPAKLDGVALSGRPPANSAPIVAASMTLFAKPARSGSAATPVELDPLRAYFDAAGVLVLRPSPAHGGRLAASIKAGGNSNHSHNDIGAYVIALGREQPTGDPGAPRYTARTFSKERYTIRAINSYGHPVPRIDGSLQRDATAVKGLAPQVRFSADRDEFQLDLRPAYDLPGLRQLTRSLAFLRGGAGEVQLEDRFAFEQPREFEVPLIVSGYWRAIDPDQLELWQNAEHLLARIDASSAFEILPERIDEEGKVFTRLAIRLSGKQAEGRIRVRFTPLE